MKPNPAFLQHTRQFGLTLVELLIAMVLGLMIIAVAGTIFFSNKQTYQATQNLGAMQENARTAFELMSRDVREAAGNPCVNNAPVANVITNAATRWWTNLNAWGDAIRGFASDEAFPDAGFGTGTGQRLNGTAALQLFSGDDTVATISAHSTSASQFTLNTAASGFAAGDLLVACNSRQASIFQASSASGATIGHAAGGAPGNCSANLGLIAVGDACSSRQPFQYAAPNSVMVKLHATRWFIANNASGEPSLYQSRLTPTGVATSEVASGVSNMEIRYLVRDTSEYQTANDVGGAWANVIAARIELTLTGEDNAGTDNQPLERTLVQVASLRNRNP